MHGLPELVYIYYMSIVIDELDEDVKKLIL
jgi:hypothetical protein